MNLGAGGLRFVLLGVILVATTLGRRRVTFIRRPDVSAPSTMRRFVAHVVVAAIATLALTMIGQAIGPLLLVSLVALAWSLAAPLYIAPRRFRVRQYEQFQPHEQYEQYGSVDFSQLMGNATHGVVLIDMSQLTSRAEFGRGFGCRLLANDPIVGGALISTLAVPIIAGANFTILAATYALITGGFAAWGINH